MRCPRCGGQLYDHKLLPAFTRQQLDAYVFRRETPGDFLYALLTNNLKEAFNRADDGNLSALPAIVSYMYNHMPAKSQGSKERVEAWLSGETQ